MTPVRRATISDVDAIAEIHLRTWQVAFAGLIPASVLDALDVGDRKAMWTTALNSTTWPGALFVAEDDSGTVGFSSIGIEDNRGLVNTLYVDPARWSSGFGSQLLVAAESQLKDRGFNHAYLWTLKARPQSRSFYEAKGWIASGIERNEILYDATVHEIEYTKRLEN